MRQTRWLAVALVLFGVVLMATACDVPSAETTTTASDPSGVVFGRGSVPETVPSSFPVPDQARVGATLVDANRDLTEMILTFPADTAAVADYYEENLPTRGYAITESYGTEAEWLIEFTGEGLEGVIRVKTGGSGVSAATVQLTRL